MQSVSSRAGQRCCSIFTVLASLMFHRYWSLPADQAAVQQLLFMKNLSVIGGLLVLAALGPGPATLGGGGRK